MITRLNANFAGKGSALFGVYTQIMFLARNGRRCFHLPSLVLTKLWIPSFGSSEWPGSVAGTELCGQCYRIALAFSAIFPILIIRIE